MPRETVHPTTPAERDPFVMVVGWQRDMDVQVGIETREQPDGQHHLVDQVYGGELATIAKGLLELLHHNGWQLAQDPDAEQGLPLPTSEGDDASMALGRAVLDAVTGSTPFGTGVWWHPGRHQINMLIRLLRKARDAAYGRDE